MIWSEMKGKHLFVIFVFSFLTIFQCLKKILNIFLSWDPQITGFSCHLIFWNWQKKHTDQTNIFKGILKIFWSCTEQNSTHLRQYKH